MTRKFLYQLTPEEQHEQRIERRMNTCVHHNGYFYKVCDAGIEYETVGKRVDLGNLGRPFVAACQKNNEWGGVQLECEFICSKSQFLTREEAEADIAETDAKLVEHLGKIAQNICPTHNIAITKKQVGSCVYAEPCGCRLYQGRLKK